MARLTKTILAIPSGKVGNIVFKTTKRGSYISSLPSKYTIPLGEKYKKRITAFSFCTLFCAKVVKIEVLKKLWVTEERSAFTNLMSRSLKIAINEGDFSQMPLAPIPGNLNINVKEFTFERNSIKVTSNPVAGIDSQKNKLISMQGIILLEDPVDLNGVPRMFFDVYSGIKEFRSDEEMNFQFELPSEFSGAKDNYMAKKILYNFITFDDAGNPVNTSSEVSASLLI